MSTKKPAGQAPRAVLYLRQSVSREESISLELQETAGRAHASQQGYEVIAVEADPGISGRTWNRPAVQRVMTMIEEKRADIIILWKWSRLSRSRLDWAVAVDKVETAGGRIESATEAVDVSTSTGRLARGMLTEFAAFESERIGDTWKEAQARRLSQGLPHSGKKRYGYTYDRETGYTPDPVEAPILQECYRKFLRGEPVLWICDYLNDGPTVPAQGFGKTDASGYWTNITVMRMLANPFYTGRIKFKGQLYPGAHAPLIDQETYEEYMLRRSQRTNKRSAERTTHLYTGFIQCELCGHPYYASRNRAGTVNYRCHGAYNYKKHRLGYVTTTRLDEELMTWLKKYSQEIEAEANAQETQLPPIIDLEPKIRRALMKVDTRLDRMTMDLVDELIPRDAYSRAVAKLSEEKRDLEARLASVRMSARAVKDGVSPEMIEKWDDLKVEHRREILARLVGKIFITPTDMRADLELPLINIKGVWELEPE